MFSKAAAVRPIRFFERVLKLTVGRFRGNPFHLMPWQRFTLAQCFGNLDSNGLRLVREAYIQIAKKNGKSEFAAGIGLYMLLADNEPASHVYGAAAAKEQAGIVFNVASEMVKQSRMLSERLVVHPSRKRIILRRDPASFYQVISSDDNTGDGINPHAVIFDEVHRQKSTGLYSILKYGMAARDQPFMLSITTAGAQDVSPVAQAYYNRAQVQAETKDPSFFGLVFEGDKKNWKKKGKPGAACKDSTIERGGKLWRRKPTGWFAGNPSLEGNPGGFMRVADLEREVVSAEAAPATLNDFIRLRLDIWTESVSRWIPSEQWKAIEKRTNREKLQGERCYLGMDLSSTRDITAVAWTFELGGGKFESFGRYYLPEDGIEARAKRDNVPYQLWASQGFLTLTPGVSVDYDFIYRDIVELSKLYQVASITSDRWNAQGLASDLSQAGFEVRLIPQSFTEVSPAAKEVERLIRSKDLRHDKNPAMAWMCACTEIITNSEDLIRLKKPDRKKDSRRIDGMQALVNSFVGLAKQPEEVVPELLMIG